MRLETASIFSVCFDSRRQLRIGTNWYNPRTHHGYEISYVMESELHVDGQDPRRVKAGASCAIPAGTIHDAINVGGGPLKLVGVYVVEKSKPLATPAK